MTVNELQSIISNALLNYRENSIEDGNYSLESIQPENERSIIVESIDGKNYCVHIKLK